MIKNKFSVASNFSGFFKRLSLLILIVFLPLLTSCSSSYTYNNLDWMVHWLVDDYVELTPEQKQNFDLYFSQLQQWHRQNELDRYLMFLKGIRLSIEDKALTGDALALEVSRRSAESYQYWQGLIAATDKPLGKLAITLSPKQKDEFFDALERQLTELDEKAIQNDKPAQRRKQLLKAVEPWFGTLNRSQKKRLKQWSLEMTPTRAVLQKYRKDWSAGLRDALYAPRDEIPIRLSKILTAHRDWQSDEYKQAITENRHRTEKLISDLLDSRTLVQNRQLLKHLDLWIRRLERLKNA